MIATIEPIVETLQILETDIDRYEYIIELGDSLKGISESELLNDENYVPGCQSDVWLHYNFTHTQIVKLLEDFYTFLQKHLVGTHLMKCLTLICPRYRRFP